MIRQSVFAALGLALASPRAVAQTSAPSGIRITAYPEHPWIERTRDGQALNFDFGLENSTDSAQVLERLEISVLDPAGRLVHRQFVWSKGAARPAFAGIDRTVPANGAINLFNPFHTLQADLRIGKLRYDFIFAMSGLEPTRAVTVEVVPRAYRQTVRLVPPVDGPAVVYDGHEFTSHHRRIPIGDPAIRKAGFTANPVRFANDFTPVGPDGALARGSISDPTSWYGYGAIVRAPGDGVVVSAGNDVPDNRIEDGKLIMTPGPQREDAASLGNHVIIRHPNGQFSSLAHLKLGSVTVAVGDKVTAGQPVGAIGFSGDTGFHVHVHHMLSGSKDFDAEGIPMYYDRVRRISLPRSGRAEAARNGVSLDTGDLFEVAR